MIRVVLVDDHPVVRAGYQRLLDQAGDIRVVAEAGDADAGYGAFVAHAPDVLVTDLSMPGGGGLALIRHVLQRDAAAPLLVFTMHDAGPLVRRAFEAGACGFLTKASAPENLVDAVRCLKAGRRYLDPALPATLLQRDRHDEDERLAALSGREFEIFRLLASGRSAAECAQALKLSAKTISNHQTIIKEKLGVATSAALAHLAIRHQLIPGGGN